MAACIFCNGEITKNDSLTCSICSCIVHYKCIDMSESCYKKFLRDKKIKWKCSNCIDVQKLENSNAKGNEFKGFSEINSEINKQLIHIKSELVECFTRELAKLKIELKEEIARSHDDLMNKFKLSFDSLGTEITSLKEDYVQLKNENFEINKEIYQLKSQLDDFEQYSKNSNLVISGIPENVDENLFDILNVMANKLQIHNSGIIDYHRISTRKASSIKPIIVKFISKKQRNAFFAATKVKRLRANDLKENFDQMKIFVNEHLTNLNKSLFYEVRQFKAKNNYKFAWTKDGKIYLRKSESDPIIRIKELKDLDFN